MRILQDKVSARTICDKASLKRAYRKLALNIHPDVLESADATALFTELQTDYEAATALLDSFNAQQHTGVGNAPTADTEPIHRGGNQSTTDATQTPNGTHTQTAAPNATKTTQQNAAQTPFDFLVYKDCMASISSATMTALRKQTPFCQKTCARLVAEVAKTDRASAHAFYTVFCAHHLARAPRDFGEPFMNALCEYVDILQTGNRYTPYQVQTYKRISMSYFRSAVQKLESQNELAEAIAKMSAFMWRIIE